MTLVVTIKMLFKLESSPGNDTDLSALSVVTVQISLSRFQVFVVPFFDEILATFRMACLLQSRTPSSGLFEPLASRDLVSRISPPSTASFKKSP